MAKCVSESPKVISFIFIETTWYSIVLYLIGKWSVTLAYSSVYIYVSEVFPTNMRQTLISFCSMAGRIGSLLAPQTPLLMNYLPSIHPTMIFGGMCVISSFLVLMLPETSNIRLPDTIEEAEELSRKKNKIRS